MASVTKCASGYRVQVAVKGIRKSATFRTKREADAWAASTETGLRDRARLAPAEAHTLHELFSRYAADVSPSKRGARWEIVRLAAFAGQFEDVRLSAVTPEFIGLWRDGRLQSVSAGAVLRDFSLLSAVFEHARREWRWVAANPVRDVRKPRSPDHRNVTISRAQIRGMIGELGYSPRLPVRSVSQSVAVCFLLAIRKGMRAGELCGLTWERVRADHCVLLTTKTRPRDVPLDAKDLRLVEKMRGFDGRLVFGMKSQTLDALFRRARDYAGLSGFTFHDSRHTAATRLARRLDVLDLCKVFGWANPKQAMVYYNPTASDLAKRKGGG